MELIICVCNQIQHWLTVYRQKFLSLDLLLVMGVDHSFYDKRLSYKLCRGDAIVLQV